MGKGFLTASALPGHATSRTSMCSGSLSPFFQSLCHCISSLQVGDEVLISNLFFDLSGVPSLSHLIGINAGVIEKTWNALGSLRKFQRFGNLCQELGTLCIYFRIPQYDFPELLC